LGECELAADEGDRGIFGGEVEEHSDAGEDCGELPFSLFEEWLDALHEEADGTEEQDGIAEAQGFDLLCVDLWVAAVRAECAVCVPEKAADEGEDQHGGLFDRDGGAEEHQLD